MRYSTGVAPYSSFFADSAYAVALDSAGNAYVTGTSGTSDFPASEGSYQPFNRGQDVFITKLAVSYAISGRVTDSGGTGVGGMRITMTGAETRTTVTGMPIGPPSQSPEPKSACMWSSRPIEATRRSESGATGSRSTRWLK